MKLPLIRSSVLAAALCFSATASHADCGGFLFVKTCHSGSSNISDGHKAALAGDDVQATQTVTESEESSEQSKKKSKKKNKKNKKKKNHFNQE